jgi:membrane-associated phospholipid phosphatase
MISLYVSTVYGRFHYLSDVIAGIAAGILVVVVGPSIERAWDRRAAGAEALP